MTTLRQLSMLSFCCVCVCTHFYGHRSNASISIAMTSDVCVWMTHAICWDATNQTARARAHTRTCLFSNNRFPDVMVIVQRSLSFQVWLESWYKSHKETEIICELCLWILYWNTILCDVKCILGLVWHGIWKFDRIQRNSQRTRSNQELRFKASLK